MRRHSSDGPDETGFSIPSGELRAADWRSGLHPNGPASQLATAPGGLPLILFLLVGLATVITEFIFTD